MILKLYLIKPLGDASLKGAIYGIYDEYNSRIGEITTTGNGIVTSDYLPKLGKFYLLEEKSSLGYKLDSTKYYFEITENNLNPKIVVHEQVIEKKNLNYIKCFLMVAKV
ncbi:MAG: prealbumin-like fold domain-containing protein [Bacilli bacterium]|nr:MAG: prealbumin-like fold domain-containing protein [Bacilli bacterium]